MSIPVQTSPVIVKRYAGSRLYDGPGRRYVSAEQLRDWAAKGVAVEITDAETGLDITRTMLA